jgi:hypothetical protein
MSSSRPQVRVRVRVKRYQGYDMSGNEYIRVRVRVVEL